MFGENETYDYWQVLRYIANNGISTFINGGVHYGYFEDLDDGLQTISEILTWLSEQDEFEWCEALSKAKDKYLQSIEYKTFSKTKVAK